MSSPIDTTEWRFPITEKPNMFYGKFGAPAGLFRAFHRRGEVLYDSSFNPITTIVVRNFKLNTPEDQIKDFFDVYGLIKECKFISYPRSIRIRYAHPCAAFRAITSRKKMSQDIPYQVVPSMYEIDQESHLRASNLVRRNYEGSASNLMMLNDDCILLILEYLNLFDVRAVEHVNKRLQQLARCHYKKYITFAFNDIGEDITFIQACSILSQIGPYVHFLTSPTDFSINDDCGFFLRMIQKYCTSLQHLRLYYCQLDHGCLEGFRPTMDRLESLWLVDCYVEEHVFNYYVSNDTKLEELRVQYCDSTRPANIFKKLRHLKIVSINNNHGYMPFDLLMNNNKMEELDLTDCPHIEKNFITLLMRHEGVKDLTLCGDYDNRFQLRKMKLNKLKWTDNDGISEDLKFIQHHETLKILDLSKNVLEIKDFLILVTLPNLTTLRLNDIIELFDADLAIISMIPKLESFTTIKSNGFTQYGLTKLIIHCKTLKKLYVSITNVVNEEFIMKVREICNEKYRRYFFVNAWNTLYSRNRENQILDFGYLTVSTKSETAEHGYHTMNKPRKRHSNSYRIF